MDNEILIIPQTLTNNHILNSILMALFFSQYSRNLLLNHFNNKDNELFIIFDLILKKLDKTQKLYDIYNIKKLNYLFYKNKIISKLNLISILKNLIKFMKMKVIVLKDCNYNKKIKYSPDYIIVDVKECGNKFIKYNNNIYILDSCIIENFSYDNGNDNGNGNGNGNDNSIVGITSNDTKHLFNGWLIKYDKIDNDLINSKIKHSSNETLIKYDWSSENNLDFCLNISLTLIEDQDQDKSLSFHKINRTFIYVKLK
jgi:hypothetical protein